jgi:uncharacterized protein YndB with AHSA1/START domain
MAELTREVVMDASPATIFPFLTDPSQHVRWMGTEAELDPRVGGAYRVLAQGIHPGVGEFIEVVPDRKVVFTFGWDEPNHPIPARSTEVEITLTPDGDKTRVAWCIGVSPTMPSATTPTDGTTISIGWPPSPPEGRSFPTWRRQRPPAERSARANQPSCEGAFGPLRRVTTGAVLVDRLSQ